MRTSVPGIASERESDGVGVMYRVKAAEQCCLLSACLHASSWAGTCGPRIALFNKRGFNQAKMDPYPISQLSVALAADLRTDPCT